MSMKTNKRDKPLGNLTNILVSKKKKSSSSTLRVNFSQDETLEIPNVSSPFESENVNRTSFYSDNFGSYSFERDQEPDTYAYITRTDVVDEMPIEYSRHHSDINASTPSNTYSKNPYDAAFCAACNAIQEKTLIHTNENKSDVSSELINPLHRPPRRYRSLWEEASSKRPASEPKFDDSNSTKLSAAEDRINSFSKEIDTTYNYHNDEENVWARQANVELVLGSQTTEKMSRLAKWNTKMWNFIEAKLSCNDYKDMIYEEYEVKVFEHK